MDAVENVELITVSGDEIRELTPALSALFSRLVADGASMGFIAPLLPETAKAYWHKIASDVDSGGRLMMVAYVDGELAGTVQLGLAMPENGMCRTDLQKLMVHPDFRRRGLATKLVRAAEDAARAHNRRLIVLDTEQGSPAETLYEVLGYQRVGAIPDFVYATIGEGYVATVYFYRLLD